MVEGAYGKVAMKKRQVYKLYKHFRDGCTSVKEDPCCKSQSTSTNGKNIKHAYNAV
jgi:hypothetical protein